MIRFFPVWQQHAQLSVELQTNDCLDLWGCVHIEILHINITNTMLAVKIPNSNTKEQNNNNSTRALTVKVMEVKQCEAALSGSASSIQSERKPGKLAFVPTSSFFCIMWFINRHATYSTGVGGVKVWVGQDPCLPPPPLSLTSPLHKHGVWLVQSSNMFCSLSSQQQRLLKNPTVRVHLHWADVLQSVYLQSATQLALQLSEATVFCKSWNKYCKHAEL